MLKGQAHKFSAFLKIEIPFWGSQKHDWIGPKVYIRNNFQTEKSMEYLLIGHSTVGQSKNIQKSIYVPCFLRNLPNSLSLYSDRLNFANFWATLGLSKIYL